MTSVAFTRYRTRPVEVEAIRLPDADPRPPGITDWRTAAAVEAWQAVAEFLLIPDPPDRYNETVREGKHGKMRRPGPRTRGYVEVALRVRDGSSLAYAGDWLVRRMIDGEWQFRMFSDDEFRGRYEEAPPEVREFPCPHGRPSWTMCPHCLGVNTNA